MPLKVRDIIRSLQAKGYESVPARKHIKFSLVIDGVRGELTTMVSHGEKEIGDKLVGKMAREVALSAGEFKSYVDCEMTKEHYTELLRTKGLLDR